MKMMWFTLCKLPTGVGEGVGLGVGVGLLPKPTPWQPVKTLKTKKAKKHAKRFLVEEVIGPILSTLKKF